ncbi:hypothetical protein J2Z78_003932 [Streptomyces griseorubens]
MADTTRITDARSRIFGYTDAYGRAAGVVIEPR